jgi:hypothetical protein
MVALEKMGKGNEKELKAATIFLAESLLRNYGARILYWFYSIDRVIKILDEMLSSPKMVDIALNMVVQMMDTDETTRTKPG